MRNQSKLFLLMLVTSVIFFNCSKETNCVNNIVGDWVVASMTTEDSTGNAQNMLDNNVTYSLNFTKYNTNVQDEKGTVTSVFTVSFNGMDSSETNVDEYMISDDCGALIIFPSSGPPNDTFTIKDLTATTGVLEYDEQGTTVTVTMSKQ